jgi:hypothetical protein
MTGSSSTPAASGRKRIPWLLVLFGLPFAAAGIGMFSFLVLPTLTDWHAMKSWVPVQAELIDARLESHRGDDSTTWQAVASYRYGYGGNRWTSDRVAVSGGADNIGSFQEDLGGELERAFRDGEPITVFVDPRQPQNAVINRELRVGLIALMSVFSLVFAAVGLGIIGAALFGARAAAGDSAQQAPAATPWLARAEWASPQIAADTRAGARAMWFFALLWCLITAPANVAIPGELAKGNWAILLVLLFDVVGIGLLVHAARLTASSRKFGRVLLTMDPHPGGIGGDVGGYIDVPLPHDAALPFHVSLACTRTRVSGSGKNRSTHHEVKWQDEKWLLAEPLDATHARLWFRFEPPAGLPPSEAPSSDYTHWSLNLAAELPGLDLARHFDLPVFATAQRSSAAVAARVRVSLAQDAGALETLTQFTTVPGGAAMRFRAGRQWASALVALLVVGGMFGGGGIALLLGREHDYVALFMGGVFALVGLAGVLGGLWLLGNSLAVRVDEGGALIRRWLFGVPVLRRTVPRADILGIGFARGSTTASGTSSTVFYDLVLKTQDGKLHGIGDGFRGSSQAKMAVEVLARHARLPLLGELDRSEAFAARARK